MIIRTPSSKCTAPALAASALLLAGCATPTEPVARAQVVSPSAVAEPAVAEPATPPPAPDFSDRQMVEYTVVQGDSLWKIGRDKDVSIADIQAANDMTDTVIRTGETILLPLKGATPVVPGAATGPATIEASPVTLTPAPDTAVAPAPPAPAPAPAPGTTGALAPPPPPPPAPTEQ